MSESSDSSSDSDVDHAELEKIQDAVCDFATIGYSSLTVASSSESHAVYSSDSWTRDANEQHSQSSISEEFRHHIAAKLQASLDGQMRFKKLSTKLTDDNTWLNSEAGKRPELCSGFRLFSSSDPEWDCQPTIDETRHYRNGSMNSSASESDEEAARLSSVVVSADVITAASLPLQLSNVTSCKMTKKHKHKRSVDCNAVKLSVSSELCDSRVSDDGSKSREVRDEGSNCKPRKIKKHKRRAEESKVGKSLTNKSCDDSASDERHKVSKQEHVGKCHRNTIGQQTLADS